MAPAIVAFCKNPELGTRGLRLADASGRMKTEMSDAVLKLLHARMLLVASGGFLTGYDDKPLSTHFVAIAIKHDVKLFPCEPQLLRRHVHKAAHPRRPAIPL